MGNGNTSPLFWTCSDLYLTVDRALPVRAMERKATIARISASIGVMHHVNAVLIAGPAEQQCRSAEHIVFYLSANCVGSTGSQSPVPDFRNRDDRALSMLERAQRIQGRRGVGIHPKTDLDGGRDIEEESRRRCRKMDVGTMSVMGRKAKD